MTMVRNFFSEIVKVLERAAISFARPIDGTQDHQEISSEMWEQLLPLLPSLQSYEPGFPDESAELFSATSGEKPQDLLSSTVNRMQLCVEDFALRERNQCPESLTFQNSGELTITPDCLRGIEWEGETNTVGIITIEPCDSEKLKKEKIFLQRYSLVIQKKNNDGTVHPLVHFYFSINEIQLFPTASDRSSHFISAAILERTITPERCISDLLEDFDSYISRVAKVRDLAQRIYNALDMKNKNIE